MYFYFRRRWFITPYNGDITTSIKRQINILSSKSTVKCLLHFFKIYFLFAKYNNIIKSLGTALYYYSVGPGNENNNYSTLHARTMIVAKCDSNYHVWIHFIVFCHFLSHIHRRSYVRNLFYYNNIARTLSLETTTIMTVTISVEKADLHIWSCRIYIIF